MEIQLDFTNYLHQEAHKGCEQDGTAFRLALVLSLYLLDAIREHLKGGQRLMGACCGKSNAVASETGDKDSANSKKVNPPDIPGEQPNGQVKQASLHDDQNQWSKASPSMGYHFSAIM